MEKDNRLNTLGQIKALAEKSPVAKYWFDRDTMRWFNSRISEAVYPTGITECGTYFVSSERHSPTERRYYTVRQAVILDGEFGPYVRISTPDPRPDVSGFQYYKSLSGAHAAAKRMRDAARAKHNTEGTLFESTND